MLALIQRLGSYYFVSLLDFILMFKNPLSGKLGVREVSSSIQVRNFPGSTNKEPDSSNFPKMLKMPQGHTFPVSCPFHKVLRTRPRDKVQRTGWELEDLRFHPSSAPEAILSPPLPWFDAYSLCAGQKLKEFSGGVRSEDSHVRANCRQTLGRV